MLSNFQWISGRGVRRDFTHKSVKIVSLIDFLRILKIIGEYGLLRTLVEDVYEDLSHLEKPMETIF